MGRTTIEVDEEVRDRLRRYKSIEGQTYDEAIEELLDMAPWVDPIAGEEDVLDVPEKEVEQLDYQAGEISQLDLPGQGEVEERRRDAVRAVYERLREEGEASTSDLQAVAWEVAGETYSDERSLWKNCVYPALGKLSDVETAGPSGRWLYSG